MSSSFQFQWEDNKRTVVALKIKAALKRGLRLAGEHILNVSNRQVPHEDGDLERSGVVTEADGTTMVVAISYDTPYAVIQHEDLTFRHDPGRNAKFLSNACQSEARTAGKIVAQAVRQVTGG